MTGKLAVGYGRVSTSGQAAEGVSLEAQKERFHEWCQHNGYTPSNYYSDPGKSGKRMNNRPGLLSALKAVTEANGALVVYSLSRMARSTRDALDIVDVLQKGGADLVSLSEHIDTTTTTPFGTFFFTVMAAMAQLDRDIIARNTANSLQFLMENGQVHCRAKYGFQKVQDGRIVDKKNPEGGNANWEPVQQEQRVIDRILRWRAEGIGYHSIANFLNDEEIPPPRGSKWHPSGVRSVERTALKAPTA